ncbi:glycyl radical protein [Synergistes jonesii]|uniref:Pyruvate formate-lyase n=1 Tax=Synergistes jonesii TaxID=2754 RepID=A0A073J0W2_9BACT|nr:pyruvate formate lyase family protein [Synergistes jonesii]KEJ91332.1 hypothetical protein EH55_10830 [Synergistes jonesii]OFB60400.1 hypothetical protein JS73_11700 [Synergistes jonesii]OFB61225.1 hypothetical protein JS79_11850 [Synergistes jonesii]OFB62892.1 hypothetical protein JS72_07580 [Synergistes jonesii]OFB66611.1 hypothetical protein JS78_11720 [Synergistes jonesii]
MNERVARLKKEVLTVKPGLSAERVVLATEAYKKYAGEPIYLHRAHVLEYVLDNKAIVVRPDDLLLGTLTEQVRAAILFPEYESTEMWLRKEIPGMSKRKSDPMVIQPGDEQKIMDILGFWDGKATEDLIYAEMPQKLRDGEKSGAFKSGGKGICSSAIHANFQKMFKIGFRGRIDRCNKLIDEAINSGEGVNVDKQRKINFWRATIIVLEAVIRYANRCADECERQAAECQDEARKVELLEMARISRKVPEFPPETFHEAIQFQWMMQVINNVESSSYSSSLGRIDRNLWPYYDADIKAGRITRERALELVECLFIKSTTVFYVNDEYYSQADAGYPTWQICLIGGVDAEGNEMCNEITDIVLDAADELRIAQPVALRVTKNMPEHIMRKAIRMNRDGIGNPAFFSDSMAQKMVTNKGATVEQARDWGIFGCVEPGPGCGGTDGSATGGNINLPKILEITLHNGIDPVTGLDVGLRTGDPCDWTCKEQLIEAYLKQVEHFWDAHMRTYRITTGIQASYLPMIYQSALIEGCIENGESIQDGGANLSFTNIFITAPSTLTDSIVAIDYAVFKQKVLTMDKLIDLCDTDFEGEERWRQYLINKAPKFGNDIPEVDKLSAELIDKIVKMCNLHSDGRHNGKFSCGNQSQTHNVPLGRIVGATPDGRHAFTPLSDNASPNMGRDTSGPTAAANSVAHMRHENFHGGSLYNTRFDPSGVAGERGVDIIEGIVKNYVDEGGYHIQINVVDDKTLREAQKKPEDYRDLVVRVAGYLAYFTELDHEVQDVIISRTAHLAQ